MRTLKLAIPSLIVLAGFVVCTTATYAKPEYAKKEGKSCVTCHVKMGQKDLNETGKCYASNDHSLTKCSSK